MSKRPNALARAALRLYVRVEAWRYRRSGGTRTGFGDNPQLLLTTVGRKSGKERTVPLFYHPTGDRYVVIASYGGSDAHPAWWLNLREEGTGIVEVGAERFTATATELEGEEREHAWAAMREFWPSYDDYAQKTERRLPVVALDRVRG